MPASTLPPGGYSVEWEQDHGRGRTGLTVLRTADEATLLARLAGAESRLSRGSVATLRFRIEEIGRERERLRAGDTAASLRLAIDDLVEALEAAERGIDIVATRTGLQRRAYRSTLDGTLQPYSIKVPRDYSAASRHAMIVYLHGSGEDDREQLSRRWLPERAIAVAPKGRGTSTWYWTDDAQDDIREVIDDVVTHYAVDPERIVLAGFSMGGYGVYLTARERPGRFRALAIFSGSPNARGVATSGAPDFLQERDLTALTRVPRFVFHGGQDRNCPIEETRALVDRLRGAGADVTFVVEGEKGHEAPGAETLDAFGQWLSRFTVPLRP